MEEAIYSQAENGLLSWHSTAFRNYTASIGSNETAQTVLVPARFSSLRNLTFVMRPATNINNALRASISGRQRGLLQEFSLRIGNSRFPQTPIKTMLPDGTTAEDSMVVPELLRSFHMLDGAMETGLVLTNTASLRLLAAK